jgi:hypothetical protein
MARYSAGFSVSGINSANGMVATLMNTSTTLRLEVEMIAVGVAVAPTTAPSFYLSRATARGTNTTTLAGQPFDPGDPASLATLDSVNSVAPTFSTSALMARGGLATTAGGWWIWDFRDKPIIIPATTASGLTLANANASGSTTGTFAGYFAWDE